MRTRVINLGLDVVPRRKRRGYSAALTPPGSTLTAGTASFGTSSATTITISATDATNGTPAYTYQWQRNSNGGAYSNLSNGGGVSGATTRSLTDASGTSGVLYGYRLVYTDSASATATSNAVTAQLYSGGPLTGGTPQISPRFIGGICG